MGAAADSGFVAFLLMGCGRNPHADARGALDPTPSTNVSGGRVCRNLAGLCCT